MTTCQRLETLRRNAAAALLLLALTARPAPGITVSFPDFSDATGLALNGSAATESTGDGVVLRLVPAEAAKAGSFFSASTIRVADFSTAFSFRITNPGGMTDAQGEQGADGLVFVVQPVASNVGGAGSGLGYAGITPSLGVEFDIYYNGGADPSTNHVGIDLNGNVNSAVDLPVSPRWDDGNRWYAWIDYDGTTLEVRATQTGVRPADPLLSHTVDLEMLIGQPAAFVGFTAGTGAAWAAHDIIEWTYFDSFNPGGTTTTTVATSTTTTTTTSPSGCGAEVTFAALNCRLAALIARVEAASDVGPLRERVLANLSKAKQRKEGAEAQCRQPNLRRTKSLLKKAIRRMIQLKHAVRSRQAKRSMAPALRDEIVAAADRLQAELRALRDAVRCPDDAPPG